MNSKGFTKLDELGFSWSAESGCIDKLQRYNNLLEGKHEYSRKSLSKKRNLSTCNTKEKSSHKKKKKENMMETRNTTRRAISN